MNEIAEAFRGLVPTQIQFEWGGIVATVGTVFSYICGWDKAVEGLLWLMLLDYISGIMALDSRKGYKGIQ